MYGDITYKVSLLKIVLWLIVEKIIAVYLAIILVVGFTPEIVESETTDRDESVIIKKELTVPEKIIERSLELGVDPSLALNIACAESQFNPLADNPHSTADGVFQFLDGSWEYYGRRYWGTTEHRHKYNADDNIELALLVLSDKGTSDWNASKTSGLGGGWSRDPYGRGLCN